MCISLVKINPQYGKVKSIHPKLSRLQKLTLNQIIQITKRSNKHQSSMKNLKKKLKNHHNRTNPLSFTIIALTFMKYLVNKNANDFAYNSYPKSPKFTQDLRANSHPKMSPKPSTNSLIISSNVSNGRLLDSLKESPYSKVSPGTTSKRQRPCFSKRGNTFSTGQRLLILLVLHPIRNKFITLRMSSKYLNWLSSSR